MTTDADPITYGSVRFPVRLTLQGHIPLVVHCHDRTQWVSLSRPDIVGPDTPLVEALLRHFSQEALAAEAQYAQEVTHALALLDRCSGILVLTAGKVVDDFLDTSMSFTSTFRWESREEMAARGIDVRPQEPK